MVSELEEMPEELLQRYAQYAREYMLPGHRQEFYMAQFSHLIAASNGAECDVTDFLLNYEEPEEAEVIVDDDYNPFFD